LRKSLLKRRSQYLFLIRSQKRIKSQLQLQVDCLDQQHKIKALYFHNHNNQSLHYLDNQLKSNNNNHLNKDKLSKQTKSHQLHCLICHKHQFSLNKSNLQKSMRKSNKVNQWLEEDYLQDKANHSYLRLAQHQLIMHCLVVDKLKNLKDYHLTQWICSIKRHQFHNPLWR